MGSPNAAPGLRPRLAEAFGALLALHPHRRLDPAQAAEGRTGGDLGVLGPPCGKAGPEWPTTAFGWTEGCVAAGTDADVVVIATFVRERQPVVVIC